MHNRLRLSALTLLFVAAASAVGVYVVRCGTLDASCSRPATDERATFASVTSSASASLASPDTAKPAATAPPNATPPVRERPSGDESLRSAVAATTSAPAAAPSPAIAYLLIGTTIEGDSASALLRTRDGETTLTLRRGDRLNGMAIVAIGRERITLAGPGGTEDLPLGAQVFHAAAPQATSEPTEASSASDADVGMFADRQFGHLQHAGDLTSPDGEPSNH